MPSTLEIETPNGPARAHLDARRSPRALLVVSHGAGGGVDSADILAACAVAKDLGCTVARVEQPYRVAGRRAPAPAKQLDENWLAIVDALRAKVPAGTPVISAGRSMGARVACRTAADVDAAGVLCLAFPVQPKPRAGKEPPPDRLHELDSVRVPVLVVQGLTDAFGMPPARRGRTVATVTGDHALTADVPAVAVAVERWLAKLLD